MFLLLSCFSCQGFQVQQETKNFKWVCRRCNHRQSVKKVHYHSHSAAECRKVLTKITYQLASKGDERKSIPWYLLTDCVAPPSDRTDYANDGGKDPSPMRNSNFDQDGMPAMHFRSSSDHRCDSEMRGTSQYSEPHSGKRIDREWNPEQDDSARASKRYNDDSALRMSPLHPESFQISDNSGYTYRSQSDREHLTSPSHASTYTHIDSPHSHNECTNDPMPSQYDKMPAVQGPVSNPENVWESDAWDNI